MNQSIVYINENVSESEIAYEWIIKSITSSKNRFHVECCSKLISLFESRYPDSKEYLDKLMYQLMCKENSISYF